MMTLLILVSATWMGLYLAKRITRPVQLLAAGARADRRRPPRSPHRARDARRVRRADRGVQLDGGRAGRQPAPARALATRPRAQEHRERAAPALHRDHPRAHRDRRDLGRRRTVASPPSTARPCACCSSTPRSAGQPLGDGARPRPDLAPLAPAIERAQRARGTRARRARRWRWSSTAASCTSRSPARRLRRRRASPRARWSCSTT